ncbi:MAG: hypothetical protein KC613_06665 [Myxococcales bacterium]|nr:hypothetical protein [Myxococcales bacterium]MCB9525090.1 hypothetical protein [Myxococcales bacterium]
MIRPRFALALALGLVLPIGLAQAQTVTVLAPVGQGPDTAALAAELADAIDRGLAVAPRLRRMNRDALLPEDLLLTFGCAAVDGECARAAARAAGTERVLLPRFEQRGDRLSVRLDLLAPDRRRHDHRVTWLVGPLTSIDDPRLRVALRHIAHSALGGARQGAVLIPALGLDVRAGRQPLEPLVANPVPPGPLALTVRGFPAQRLEIAAGEVVFLDPSGLSAAAGDPAPPGGRRVAAWLVTGAAVASLVAASVVAVQLQATQSDYDRTANGAALGELKSRGEQQALTANALFVTAGLGAAVSALLFWGPGS